MSDENTIANIKAQIIILSRIRDAIKEVSPTHVFRTIQHRDEVFNAVIEALENLEDRLEELEEGLFQEHDDTNS